MSDRGNCPDCIEQIEAQAAEIERLGSVIDATALHWLALQDKYPIQWEGAIDGAMSAACAEIEKLREALEYYADRDNQCPNKGPWGVNSTDFGLVALKALKALKALGETK